MEKISKGDTVWVQATVIAEQRPGYWLKVHGTAPIKVKKSDVTRVEPQPEPSAVLVKATIDISGYRVKDVIQYLESWEEQIRQLGYVKHREIADDDRSVTFFCKFESDESDEMHARDRAQETMQELETDAGIIDWEYTEQS